MLNSRASWRGLAQANEAELVSEYPRIIADYARALAACVGAKVILCTSFTTVSHPGNAMQLGACKVRILQYAASQGRQTVHDFLDLGAPTMPSIEEHPCRPLIDGAIGTLDPQVQWPPRHCRGGSGLRGLRVSVF